MVAPRFPGSSSLRDLHARGVLLPLVLALVVVGVLVHGALHRETPAPQPSPTPDVPPTPAPFRPELEKIPLTYFSDYWRQLADRGQVGLVTLGSQRVPAVRLRSGLALTTLGGADIVSADLGAGEGRLVAADAREGVALFELTSDEATPPPAPAQALRAGAWLAAVSLDPERGLQVTPGHLATTPRNGDMGLDVAMNFPPSLDIGAVVDLDGGLAGMALRSPRGVRVLSILGAGSLIDRLAANPVCRAIEVSALPDSVRSALRVKGGVLVARVWTDAFVAPPDLKPGDLLLRWDAKELAGPDDFAAAYDESEPGSTVRFVAARGARRSVGRVEMPGPDGRPEGMTPRELSGLGAVVQWIRGDETNGAPEPGLRLLHVRAGGRAAQAGLEAGDVLLAVDGRPMAWPEARRLLRGETRERRPPVITVRRAGSVRLVVLPGIAEG